MAIIFGSLIYSGSHDDTELFKMSLENMELNCPDCGVKINISEQISHLLKEEMDDQRKNIATQVRKEMKQNHEVELQSYKERLEKKESEIQSNNQADIEKDLEIQKLKHELDTSDKRIEVEKDKATLEGKKQALAEYRKMADELAEQKTAELQMKNNELMDQMRQQKELFKEQLRKAEQGSIQSQGEGAEIFIEELLKQAFPMDRVDEVPKGTPGADVLQVVRFGSGIAAGKIVWEGKRAKNWANKWIAKVKEDTVRVNGHISVIVSDVLPSGIDKMKQIEENVWICRFTEIEGLCSALRTGLIRAETAVKSQEGKGSKMEHLYDYMASQEFSNAMRLINDSYIAELDIIEKERRSMERNWTSRRKAADARLRGFNEFFGTVKEIATELPAIKEIEEDDQWALPSPEDDQE